MYRFLPEGTNDFMLNRLTQGYLIYQTRIATEPEGNETKMRLNGVNMCPIVCILARQSVNFFLMTSHPEPLIQI